VSYPDLYGDKKSRLENEEGKMTRRNEEYVVVIDSLFLCLTYITTTSSNIS